MFNRFPRSSRNPAQHITKSQKETQKQRDELIQEGRNKEQERQRKEKAKQENNKKQRNKKNKEERNKKKLKNMLSRSLNEDSQDIINKLRNKISNILNGSGSNKPLEKLNKIIVEVYKAYGAVDEVCVIVKKGIKTLSETNRIEILAKIKDYSRVTTKLNEIVEKIKSIEKKVKDYNKYKDEIKKTVDKLSKNQDIINKINYIDNKLLVDSEGTIKNQIVDLKKLIKKRLSKPNMWIPPKGLEKIKNKDKGLEKKVKDLSELFNDSHSSLMSPIIDILDGPMKEIQKIKTKSYKNSNKKNVTREISTRNYGTQTRNPYRRGGSKKSVKINNSNIHKYLNVPKSYKFRKSSIERINKVKLNEYFTFRRNRYKMNKIIKKNINLANSFLNK